MKVFLAGVQAIIFATFAVLATPLEITEFEGLSATAKLSKLKDGAQKPGEHSHLHSEDVIQALFDGENDEAVADEVGAFLGKEDKYTELNEILLTVYSHKQRDASKKKNAMLKIFRDKEKSIPLRREALNAIATEPEFTDAGLFKQLLKEFGTDEESKRLVLSSWGRFAKQHSEINHGISIAVIDSAFGEENGSNPDRTMWIILAQHCHKSDADAFLKGIVSGTIGASLREKNTALNVLKQTSGSMVAFFKSHSDIVQTLYMNNSPLNSRIFTVTKHKTRGEVQEIVSILRENMGVAQALDIVRYTSCLRDTILNDGFREMAESCLGSTEPSSRIIGYKAARRLFDSHKDAYTFVAPYAAKESDPDCKDFLTMSFGAAVLTGNAYPFESKK